MRGIAAAPFDPVRVAGHECDAWVGYYRRDWRLVLRGAVGMVRDGFGLSWHRTARGAWFVLRANQAWAPYPDNDPDAATRYMTRFYALLGHPGPGAGDPAALINPGLDPAEAARLEVAWWREHRDLQHAGSDLDDSRLTAALAALYAYVYAVDPAPVTGAAAERARAMRISDAWVADGCRPADPRIRQERAALVSSYSQLLDALVYPG